jgi:hypothetical protein
MPAIPRTLSSAVTWISSMRALRTPCFRCFKDVIKLVWRMGLITQKV